ncbi:hypothetical protein E2320_022225, partial [Naja naja]
SWRQEPEEKQQQQEERQPSHSSPRSEIKSEGQADLLLLQHWHHRGDETFPTIIFIGHQPNPVPLEIEQMDLGVKNTEKSSTRTYDLSYKGLRCFFHYRPILKNYQQFLALVFAVREFNKDLVLLPSITLGFQIYDNTHTERMISITCLLLPSTRKNMIPGYKCGRQDSLLSEYRSLYPSFFRINLSELPECVGIVQLLLHFQRNWVGLVTSDDDTGEHFISTLRPMLKEEEICLGLTEMLEGENCDLIMMNLFFNICVKAEVVILFGESSTMTNFVTALYDMVMYAEMTCQNVWILTSHWKFTMTGNKFEGVKTLYGALQFKDHTSDVPDFTLFLQSLDPMNH